MSWKNKKVLITGGSSGIGLEVIKQALKGGAFVSVLTRSSSSGLASLACDNLFVYHASVDIQADVAAWVSHSIEKLGSIDTLINNAGAMYYMDVTKPDYQQMKTMIDTNCLGFINLIQSILPHLKQVKKSHWINITSDAGKQAFPGLAIYSGTKAFVEFSAKAMRLELIKHNIKVTNIQPGNVDTPLHTRSTELEAIDEFGTVNQGQYLNPSDIANAITYAISTPHHVAVNEILIEPLTESI